MPVTLLTFEQALRQGEEGKRHVLLGNGFSRACRNDIFSYDALLSQADFSELSAFARQAFDALRTTDFEVVIRSLRNAATLVTTYEGSNPRLATRLQADADELRHLLVATIARNHPDHPGEIAQAKYAACRRFLAHFNRIFTLNYDLLLYWAFMQEELEPPIECDDGFRTPDAGREDYVTWEPENTYHQRLYYLHGGLHIFDSRTEIKKYTWVNTGVRLTTQIRDALDRGLYPLFVAEGSSEQKLEHIRHSDFLDKAHRSLFPLGGTLFTFGFSMSDQDAHINRAISKSKVGLLVVGLHGDPESPGNRAIRDRASRIVALRPARRPLQLAFYDASAAAPWG